MLRIRNLSVEKDDTPICTVESFELKPGERVGVVGVNGSGKSTLLRVLARLERTFRGEYRCDLDPRQVVYAHQKPFLFRGSVLSNVAYGLAARRIPAGERMALARRWLDVFEVGHLATQRCGHLSGGEQRRVALARVFAIQPALLLLDEPLADLDERGVARVSQAIATASSTTIVIASPQPLPGGFVQRTCRLTLPSPS